MFSFSHFCYSSKSLPLISFSYSFSKCLFQIWFVGVFISWLPGETKKHLHYKKKPVCSNSCSHSPSLYWVNKMLIFLFLNSKHKLMLVKTQTKWALIRVNYVVLVFGTKKNLFNPIIEKLAIIEKVLRSWRMSISHDSFHSCWWILN